MKLFAEKPHLLKVAFYGIVFLLCLYLGQIVFGNQGFFDLRQLQRELATLKKENAKLEKKNQALYRTVQRLKNDPEYIEHIARQELQMIGEDEVVFKFRDNRDEKNKD
ncbi:MAG: FtsB family cell division protein [Thermodesulfobacteriota bacterium]